VLMVKRMNAGQIAIDRRGLIASAVGAGLALGLRRTGAIAQEAATPPAAEVPEGAAAWLKYNLNSASTEQLQGIPGAGERMTREFEEYRPYTNIGQFRGEIGKYVSSEEVAAFEDYLFVPVDPNQADADTIQQLPGMTPDLVQTLIAGRPYDSTDAFLAALGQSVAPDLVNAARTFLAPDAGATATWLKYNLNTASEAQLMSIPGAGERMTREFAEYRPYTTIEQFRGEIGKYVSPEEVAAFEKYLFVPVAPSQADTDTLQQLPGVNADIAQTLLAEGPFDSVESFLAVLETTLPPQFVELAKTYVASA
jgi:DNA uptake protein ComE-like DNA-binding protein